MSLVNPRLQNFSQPLLLAILIGGATLAATTGFFAFELSNERCFYPTYTTPQAAVEVTEPQYIAGFNAQVKYANNLRYGGTVCTDAKRDAGLCGLGPTMTYNVLGTHELPEIDPGEDVSGEDVQSFFRKTKSSQKFIDRSKPNEETIITVNTTKTTTYAVCVSDVAGFIVPDVQRSGAYMTEPKNSTAPVIANEARDATYASDVLHVYPQIGQWNCNPPNEFYQFRQSSTAGLYFFHPSLGRRYPAPVAEPWGEPVPGVGHYATWANPISDHPLPVCGGLDRQPPAHGGSNTQPFYSDGQWTDLAYICNARGRGSGMEMPVLVNYRVVAMTDYEVSWSPREICVQNTLFSAIGTALAYSTYFEVLLTVLFLGLLVPAGVVKMKHKISMSDVASGELSVDEKLLARIAELEKLSDSFKQQPVSKLASTQQLA